MPTHKVHRWPKDRLSFGSLIRLFLILLLPFGAVAKDIYSIHSLSEGEVQQTYIQLLRDACHYADGYWTNSSFSPVAGYWGDGVSSGNEGIRTVSSMVLACATLLKYDNGLSSRDRRDLLNKTIAALRYATATHITGKHQCADGKQWGGMDRPGFAAWQSSYWTGALAFGALLIWDKLDPSLRQDIERMMAAQDDLLAQGIPPTGLWSDTKAEENGWNVPSLVLGELMFPYNPRLEVWRDTARKYMMNTLCTAADTNDTRVVDERPVNQWVVGANLQPDYTLENHGFFHPSYVGCSCYFMTQAALYYAFMGKPIPHAASHHLMDTWRMFQTIILPWGETADPQGMDWELHGLPFINLYASLATRGRDPFASRMEQMSLQYQRAWQIMCKGSLTLPGSSFGIARHAINAEQASYGLLAHKIYGPSVGPLSESRAGTQEQGVRDYPYVDFIAQRTQQKFASFSWKNKVMGLLMPIEDHEANPDFIVPIANGFIGSFVPAPRGKAEVTVVEQDRKETVDGFEASGTVLIDGGRLKQTLRMISIGRQTVVYEDRVTALTDVTLQGERGLPVGIENDSLTGGTRIVSDKRGRLTFDWQKPKQPVALPGSWANVDGRLGVVTVAGSGLAYAQANKYSRGLGVYTDVLYGSYTNQTRQFKAGDTVGRRIAIFYVEVTPRETARLAKSWGIATTPGSQLLDFKQPDGKATQVPLLY